MATNFPASLDSYSTKAAGSTIAEGHVNDPQDAIEIIEQKLGVGASGTIAQSASTNTALLGYGASLTGYTTISLNNTSLISGVLAVANGGTGTTSSIGYILLKDEKTEDTEGGTFTAGAWQTRVINVEEIDTGSNCAIASNQITLDAGTYECFISCPSIACSANKVRLYNISDTAVELVGGTVYHLNGGGAAVLFGRFTIAAQKIFEIQHYGTATQAANGFGVAMDITGEVETYSVAEFRKVA